MDKFEPVSRGGEIGHAEEAAGRLIVSGCDGAVDPELAEHAFDAVALLVKGPVIVDSIGSWPFKKRHSAPVKSPLLNQPHRLAP